MQSTLLTERGKRCLTRAWTKHGARVIKNFQNDKFYLNRWVQEVADRAKKNEVHIHRLRNHLAGKVNDLVFDNDPDDRGAEDSAVAGGKTPFQGESEVACVISDAQQARRYLQAMTVLDILEEERVRDLLILEYTQAASDSLEADASAGNQWLKRLWRMLLSFGSKVPFC